MRGRSWADCCAERDDHRARHGSVRDAEASGDGGTGGMDGADRGRLVGSGTEANDVLGMGRLQGLAARGEESCASHAGARGFDLGEIRERGGGKLRVERRQGADDVGAVRVTSQASGSACVRRLRRQRGGQQRGGRRRGVFSGGARHASRLSFMLGA